MIFVIELWNDVMNLKCLEIHKHSACKTSVTPSRYKTE